MPADLMVQGPPEAAIAETKTKAGQTKALVYKTHSCKPQLQALERLLACLKVLHTKDEGRCV